jgi:hypothetical protein
MKFEKKHRRTAVQKILSQRHGDNKKRAALSSRENSGKNKRKKTPSRRNSRTGND